MDTRALFLGVGSGLLAATLTLGIGQSLSSTQPVMPAPIQQGGDWKQAAEQAGMAVLTKQELDERLAAAKSEGAKQKAEELAQVPSAPQTVSVYIQPGMGTNDVALLLQAAGVLANGNELIRLRQGHPNPIRSGTYQLPVHGDPQAVLKQIATPPK
ncbi:hypothetical protein OS242_01010 [Tumebacillus sp. DT12]|uniref:Aminodeoxychorismate lyase n=1 Tax=Tumebacillus lacus TaxID=2995335 RepID=A0ABT3WVC1_9BACL|nr:hypothetical protein [Tumebacillus lacus]MCX7568546.1 hypothetical protein [Tumebacillus lacus]